jgi:hypothetical protein
VLLGAIAAGEKVIASRASEVSKFIQENYGDSLAIEMEGHGLLGAASINEQVDALVIRGISDLLDKKADSDSAGAQELAASHAAAFAFELLASIEPAPMLPMTSSVTRAPEMPRLPPGQAQALIRIVDKSGRADHQTIGEAMRPRLGNKSSSGRGCMKSRSSLIRCWSYSAKAAKEAMSLFNAAKLPVCPFELP